MCIKFNIHTIWYIIYIKSANIRAGKSQRMPNDQVHEVFNGLIGSQMKKTSYEGKHKAGSELGLTIKCKKSEDSYEKHERYGNFSFHSLFYT